MDFEAQIIDSILEMNLGFDTSGSKEDSSQSLKHAQMLGSGFY